MTRIKRNSIISIIVLVMFLQLTACSSKRGATGAGKIVKQSAMLVEESPSVAVVHSSLSSSVRITAEVGDKTVSASGTMRLKRNEGVQVSITALGLLEVAYLEFMPASMRALYKIGKQYADVSYIDIPFLDRTGIDYLVLESVLMNRMFSPDGRPIAEAIKDMDFVLSGDTIIATAPEHKGIVYRFYIDRNSLNLVRSEGMHSGGAGVVCSYSDFDVLDGVQFPRLITIAVEGTNKRAVFSFKLSNLSVGKFDFKPRKISSGYDKVDVSELLKAVGGF